MDASKFYVSLSNKKNSYESNGNWQEWCYWLGSGISAICSAIAAISVANANVEKMPGGAFVVALLAIVPAVWAAIDRTINVRRLSVYNFRMATNLEKLLLEIGDNPTGNLDPNILKKYIDFLEIEQSKFEEIMSTNAD